MRFNDIEKDLNPYLSTDEKLVWVGQPNFKSIFYLSFSSPVSFEMINNVQEVYNLIIELHSNAD